MSGVNIIIQMNFKQYIGPWPSGAKVLQDDEEILAANGTIGAGPFTGIVNGLDKVTLGSLLGASGNLVSIPVDGDSMLGAGIEDGDTAVIDVDVSRVQNGDCVAVYYDGGFTLKYIRHEDNAIWLIPDNQNMKPMKFVPPAVPEICGICITAFPPRPRLSQNRFALIKGSAKGVDVFGADKRDEAPKEATPKVSREMQRRMAFRKSLAEMIATKDNTGKEIFTKKVHWLAIFRAAVERGFAVEQHYSDFDDYLRYLDLTDLPVDYDKDVVRKIDLGVYHLPISEWTSDAYLDKNMAKTARPFLEMLKVASAFLDILDRNLKAAA